MLKKNMRYFVSILTAVLFFIWILPLGVFIKPSQEEKACNGQRAICLCSHFVAKEMAKNAGEKIYKGSGAAQKEQNGPGGSSHQFLLAQKTNQTNNHISLYHQEQSSLYSLLVVRSIEPVPKV